MPQDFLHLAHKIRHETIPTEKPSLEEESTRYSSAKVKGNCEMCGREGVDVHHLQPQEQAGHDGFIGTFHKNHKANLSNLCKECHQRVTVERIQHRRMKTSRGRVLIPVGEAAGINM